jgi:RNA polymerase sigma factor (sigma-70 family)
MPPLDPQTATWFEQEVRPHTAGLRTWLRSRFPTLTDPDDVIQDSLMRLLRAHATGKVTNARAFLFSTARNAAVDLFRRNQVVSWQPLPSAPAVVDNGADVAETISCAQEMEILQAAIQALPARCREVMVLQKIQGLSNQEIAQRLGISVHTVNAQMVVGLMRCRKFLRERGVFRGRPA